MSKDMLSFFITAIFFINHFGYAGSPVFKIQNFEKKQRVFLFPVSSGIKEIGVVSDVLFDGNVTIRFIESESGLIKEKTVPADDIDKYERVDLNSKNYDQYKTLLSDSIAVLGTINQSTNEQLKTRAHKDLQESLVVDYEREKLKRETIEEEKRRKQSSNDLDQLFEGYKECLSHYGDQKEKFRFATRRISRDAMHHLFIDKKRLKEPSDDEIIALRQRHNNNRAYLFDIREPGYIKHMMEAFQFMGETISQDISISLITQLHAKAVKDVENLSKSKENIHITQISNESQRYGIPSEYKVSPEVFEFSTLNGQKQHNFQSTCDAPALSTVMEGFLGVTQIFNNVEEIRRWYERLHPEIKKEDQLELAIESRFEPEFKAYHKAIEAAGGDDHKKFVAIGQLLRKLEMAHIFRDGNQRTYSFLVLNKLLIQNNFPPAILDDPFLFDGYAKYDSDTIGIEIQKGVYNFLFKSHFDGKQNKMSPLGRCKG
jgi:regulator of replication initiation timing